MKIAVLFGSFNPITNAHVALIKSAVQALGAKKGLLVATNDRYLRRKAIKHNHEFCLDEQERRQMIEDAFADQDVVEFWGYELGGENPQRYKTLCKIAKQHPGCQLVEIQGADKVGTIAISSQASEYVANTQFAVFGRGEIDIDALLERDPLLRQHKDSFTLLPPLQDGTDVSSTEVRRRFYAGQDYSDLVPAGVVEVLSKRKPADFVISYADRMKSIIKTGRFGPNNARKQVYAENTKLFNEWKAGNDTLGLGNYKAFLEETKLYKQPFDVTNLGTKYQSCVGGCVNADCIDVAKYLLDSGYNPAVLNLASAKKPCGGYRDGMGAQEESLCQSSTLSLSLYQYGDPKYINVRESGVVVKQLGYPFDLNWGGIYTPNVTFFRNNISQFFTYRDQPFKCDVITVAGLSFNGRVDYSYANEMQYQAADGGFTEQGHAIMLNKIRTIFRMAVEHGKDALVLGALSCGAYKCPPEQVAKQFAIVMDEPEFRNKFRAVVFAILEKPRKPQGLDGKFAPFYRTFGTFRLD